MGGRRGAAARGTPPPDSRFGARPLQAFKYLKDRWGLRGNCASAAGAGGRGPSPGVCLSSSLPRGTRVRGLRCPEGPRPAPGSPPSTFPPGGAGGGHPGAGLGHPLPAPARNYLLQRKVLWRRCGPRCRQRWGGDGGSPQGRAPGEPAPARKGLSFILFRRGLVRM